MQDVCRDREGYQRIILTTKNTRTEKEGGTDIPWNTSHLRPSKLGILRYFFSILDAFKAIYGVHFES